MRLKKVRSQDTIIGDVCHPHLVLYLKSTNTELQLPFPKDRCLLPGYCLHPTIFQKHIMILLNQTDLIIEILLPVSTVIQHWAPLTFPDTAGLSCNSHINPVLHTKLGARELAELCPVSSAIGRFPTGKQKILGSLSEHAPIFCNSNRQCCC